MSKSLAFQVNHNRSIQDVLGKYLPFDIKAKLGELDPWHKQKLEKEIMQIDSLILEMTRAFGILKPYKTPTFNYDRITNLLKKKLF